MTVKERHRRERRARRETILAAAARVFARRGLEHATIGMIAREAEVAVGTIYLYFSSRDDLFLTLTAERIRQINGHYREIQSRGLSPLAELREIVSSYFDYLRESGDLFLTQQPVGYAELRKRLKRRSEIERFDSVMKAGREAFDLWEKSVSRVCGTGAKEGAERCATVAAAMWAGLNGAFMLTGRDNVFREFTGLSPEHFLEDALDFHLRAAELPAPGIIAPAPNGAPADSNGANGASPRRRARNTIKKPGDNAAASPHRT